MAKEQLTYEKAISRLEEIALRMENNELDIDQLCGSLKEAQTLIKFCREKLYQTDEAVKKILTEEA